MRRVLRSTSTGGDRGNAGEERPPILGFHGAFTDDDSVSILSRLPSVASLNLIFDSWDFYTDRILLGREVHYPLQDIQSVPFSKSKVQLLEAEGKRRKEPMLEALEKIKGELMVLGFISLLLTFGQIYIANVCIPTKLADTMLPCPIKHHGGHHLEPEHEPAPKEEPDHHRRLLWNDHRILAGGEPAKGCKKGLKIRGWKEWEQFETETNDEFNALAPERLD
ncbi:unnamed protein product [Camellia sinensis]